MAKVRYEALAGVISRRLWPTCSLDVTLCDFDLWGSSKDMYKTNPHTLWEPRTDATLQQLTGKISRELRATGCYGILSAFGQNGNIFSTAVAVVNFITRSKSYYHPNTLCSSLHRLLPLPRRGTRRKGGPRLSVKQEMVYPSLRP